MMNRDIIEARIQRSRIAEYASEEFRDIAPESLNALVKDDFLFAIFHSSTVWTAISESCVNFRFGGPNYRMDVTEAADKLHHSLFMDEKGLEVEFINMNSSGSRLWLGNIRVAYALQNVLNLLSALNRDD